ncbi:hypothetical protein D3C87_1671910 [compost metagenome]
MHEACDKVESMIDLARTNQELKTQSRQRAQNLFSLDAMLSMFLSLCVPVMPVSENDERIDFVPMQRMLA